MEIVKKTYELTVYGNKYSLAAPTALNSAEFMEKLKEAESKSPVEMLKCSIEFISSLGLPKEICEQLDVDDLKSLVEFLSAKKK